MRPEQGGHDALRFRWSGDVEPDRVLLGASLQAEVEKLTALPF